MSKVIIAGSRDIFDIAAVRLAIVTAVAAGLQITEVVCGCAPGVDSIGRGLAQVSGIPVNEFVADWETHGRAAGPIRNEAMASHADALILIQKDNSRGSADMLRRAIEHKLTIFHFIYKDGQIELQTVCPA